MEFSMKNFWDGSRRALARAITIVEDERDGWEDIMKEIYHHTGRAQVIGITGAPGAGKSTLSDALIKQYRNRVRKSVLWLSIRLLHSPAVLSLATVSE